MDKEAKRLGITNIETRSWDATRVDSSMIYKACLLYTSNALRKLESAGVVESRSLGMKGTRIKITNSKFKDELNKMTI